MLPLLEATLGREVVLPARKIASVDEFLTVFPDITTVFVDGTERPMQRPQAPDKQHAHYSGKKKRHTTKNVVVTDDRKRILVVSPTTEGRHHDKKVATDAAIFAHLPPAVSVHVDLGFQGIQKEYPALRLVIPQKKPPKQALSEEAKTANRQKATVRVTVEHALGGVKRVRAVTEVFRNHRTEFADRFMVIACGLWNYHLKLVA